MTTPSTPPCAARWDFDLSDALHPNVAGKVLQIAIDRWTPTPIEATIELYERDSAGPAGPVQPGQEWTDDEDDLLHTFKGRIEALKKGGFRFVSTSDKAGKGKVQAKNAFRVGFADPSAEKTAKGKPITIRGAEDGEYEGRFYEIGFRITDADGFSLQSQANVLYFAQEEACTIDLPVFNQGSWPQVRKSGSQARYKKGVKSQTTYHLPGYLGFWQRYDNPSHARTIPWLDTSVADLSSVSVQQITVEKAIELGSNDSADMNLQVGRTLMNPMAGTTPKWVAEDFSSGACKLTCLSICLWHFGVYQKVLEALQTIDPLKAHIPHRCLSPKAGIKARPKCKQSDPKTSDLCRTCTSKAVDRGNLGQVESNADGSFPDTQLPPLWFNAYVWWYLLAKNGGHTGKATDLFRSSGNFTFPEKSHVAEHCFVRPLVESGYATIKHEPVRRLLNQGIPVIAGMKTPSGGEHINLIYGCLKDGKKWVYQFVDPGRGGWIGTATLDRWFKYTAVAPADWSREKALWKVHPYEGAAKSV